MSNYLAGRPVVAVDFDNTLHDGYYGKIGKPRKRVVEKLKQRQADGWISILWTCRGGRDLEQALKWCDRHGIIFDYVNEDCAEIKTMFPHEYNTSPKVYADEYWDDKAINVKDI